MDAAVSLPQSDKRIILFSENDLIDLRHRLIQSLTRARLEAETGVVKTHVNVFNDEKSSVPEENILTIPETFQASHESNRNLDVDDNSLTDLERMRREIQKRVVHRFTKIIDKNVQVQPLKLPDIDPLDENLARKVEELEKAVEQKENQIMVLRKEIPEKFNSALVNYLQGVQSEIQKEKGQYRKIPLNTTADQVSTDLGSDPKAIAEHVNNTLQDSFMNEINPELVLLFIKKNKELAHSVQMLQQKLPKVHKRAHHIRQVLAQIDQTGGETEVDRVIHEDVRKILKSRISLGPDDFTEEEMTIKVSQRDNQGKRPMDSITPRRSARKRRLLNHLSMR